MQKQFNSCSHKKIEINSFLPRIVAVETIKGNTVVRNTMKYSCIYTSLPLEQSRQIFMFFFSTFPHCRLSKYLLFNFDQAWQMILLGSKLFGPFPFFDRNILLIPFWLFALFLFSFPPHTDLEFSHFFLMEHMITI